DDDRWGEKLALLIEHPVPVVSLTFGLPDRAELAALQKGGSRVLVGVTTPEAARLAREAGADGLDVQGADAGGHRATLDRPRGPGPVETVSLVRPVLGVVDLPVIAAGGVEGPDAVRRLLDAGAQAIAVGTLLLRTDEAGTSPTHKRALCDPTF